MISQRHLLVSCLVMFGFSIGIAGCTKPLKPELTFQVIPGAQAGQYTLSGTTNIPAQRASAAGITVSGEVLPVVVTLRALRQLNPPQALGIKPKPTYAVLAQHQVVVDKDKWQVELNLLQPSRSQASAKTALVESWQLHPEVTQSRWIPDSTVTFVATTGVLDRNLNLELTDANGKPNDKSDLLQVSSSGQPFLQAEQQISLAAPSVVGTAPLALPNVVKLSVKTLGGGSKEDINLKLNKSPLAQGEYLK